MRIGGWGGEEAYRAWLVREGIDAVIDATHPFADEMGYRTAKMACELGIEALRLMPPPWMPHKVDNWTFLNTSRKPRGIWARTPRCFWPPDVAIWHA